MSVCVCLCVCPSLAGVDPGEDDVFGGGDGDAVKLTSVSAYFLLRAFTPNTFLILEESRSSEW